MEKKRLRCKMVEKVCMFSDPPTSVLQSNLRNFAVQKIRELRFNDGPTYSGHRCQNRWTVDFTRWLFLFQLFAIKCFLFTNKSFVHILITHDGLTDYKNGHDLFGMIWNHVCCNNKLFLSLPEMSICII